jgi:hypothetical protein
VVVGVAQIPDVPAGGVPLAAAIGALRQELLQAWAQAAHDPSGNRLWFKAAPVELTVQAQVTWTGEAGAGVKWWLFSADGKVSREQVATQTVKLTLEPVTYDAHGRPVSVLIDAADSPPVGEIAGIGGAPQSLDASDD